jgi:AraC family transcriptional regulator, transcriptional activator of pobA
LHTVIPTYHINRLTGQPDTNSDVFFADDQLNFKNSPLKIPYRSDYFGIGFCQNGSATLKANLETYEVTQDCIVTMSPQIVKQWVERSSDYQTIAVFFTKEFFIQNNSDKNYIDSFTFFEANAKHVSKFNEQQAETVNALLQDIQQKLNATHPYKNEIVRSLITILLFEISAVYNQESFPSFYRQTRSEQIAAEFKKLVSLHFTKERSVHFFAKLLFISPKHLTEIIKSETGKSAKEWIDEIVILEAKVLLQEAALSVAEVGQRLSFTDQSVFGKFFKNATGLSPIGYRQGLKEPVGELSSEEKIKRF